MKALPKILLAITAAAALSFANPASANLSTNPGFETGDFTGWTLGNANATVVGSFNGVSPHSGNFQAAFGQGGGQALIQNVTTTPGASHVIDLFLAKTGPDNSTFAVQWGGSTIFSHLFTSAFGYTESTFNVTASSATTELKLILSISTANGFFLDDISVTPAGVGVPDAGSTLPLLGFASLGLVALRRFLMG